MNDISSSNLNHIPSLKYQKVNTHPSYQYSIKGTDYIIQDPLKSQVKSQQIYSTQPHSPIVHTLHSEWIDSYNNTPIPSPQKDTMSTTATQEKFETPVKAKLTAYMTPDTSENKVNVIRIDEKLLRDSTVSPIEKEVVKNVSPIDIIFSMINTIVGKDKLSKVGQYLLRLLIYHANQTRNFLSDDHINIQTIDKRYNDRTKRLDLIRNFLKHPMDFARIVMILFCSRFSKRFQGMVNGISTYRQFLRFGKTPFRVRDISFKINNAIKKNQYDKLFTRSFLGEIIGFYYGINDECLLLFKLGILTNKNLRKVVGRHESLAWYYDSILGIYNAIENINSLSQQEMDLKIQIQVKTKAKSLSKQILGLNNKNTGDATLLTYLNENSNGGDLKKLKDIEFKKFNAYLDFCKWISDFIFDSYTVFHWKLPFDTLQIWFGLSAAMLSSWKIFRDTKRKLESS